MPSPIHLAKATIIPLSDENGRERSESSRKEWTITVHFNPDSLKLTQNNTLEGGQANQPVQHVTGSTSKLEMTLVFDTTLDGNDVRLTTEVLAWFMNPVSNVNGTDAAERRLKIPAQLRFCWGTLIFTGYIETYEETIDFFSPEGVPLRASVHLVLLQANRTYEVARDSEPGKSALAAMKERAGHVDLALAGEAPLAAAGGTPEQNRTSAAENDVLDLRLPALHAGSGTA